MAGEPSAHFTPALFEFLDELSDNNNREWFQANKERYERDVRDALVRFVADFAGKLEEISPHMVADPRPSGGSVFRIYRDVRFSKDKSPYKTNSGIHFRHEVGREVHGPGFYLHLEPGNVFGGAGIWMPSSKTLANIREAIVANPGKWERIVNDQDFTSTFTLEGDSLKRAPKGIDSNHPLIEDLKRKSFVAGTTFTQDDACSPGFIGAYAGHVPDSRAVLGVPHHGRRPGVVAIAADIPIVTPAYAGVQRPGAGIPPVRGYPRLFAGSSQERRQGVEIGASSDDVGVVMAGALNGVEAFRGAWPHRRPAGPSRTVRSHPGPRAAPSRAPSSGLPCRGYRTSSSPARRCGVGTGRPALPLPLMDVKGDSRMTAYTSCLAAISAATAHPRERPNSATLPLSTSSRANTWAIAASASI